MTAHNHDEQRDEKMDVDKLIYDLVGLELKLLEDIAIMRANGEKNPAKVRELKKMARMAYSLALFVQEEY